MGKGRPPGREASPFAFHSRCHRHLHSALTRTHRQLLTSTLVRARGRRSEVGAGQVAAKVAATVDVTGTVTVAVACCGE